MSDAAPYRVWLSRFLGGASKRSRAFRGRPATAVPSGLAFGEFFHVRVGSEVQNLLGHPRILALTCHWFLAVWASFLVWVFKVS